MARAATIDLPALLTRAPSPLTAVAHPGGRVAGPGELLPGGGEADPRDERHIRSTSLRRVTAASSSFRTLIPKPGPVGISIVPSWARWNAGSAMSCA